MHLFVLLATLFVPVIAFAPCTTDNPPKVEFHADLHSHILQSAGLRGFLSASTAPDRRGVDVKLIVSGLPSRGPFSALAALISSFQSPCLLTTGLLHSIPHPYRPRPAQRHLCRDWRPLRPLPWPPLLLDDARLVVRGRRLERQARDAARSTAAWRLRSGEWRG